VANKAVLISIKTFSSQRTNLIQEALRKVAQCTKIEQASCVYRVERIAESWTGLRDLKKEERLEGLAIVIKARTKLGPEELLGKLERVQADLQREVLQRSLSINLMCYESEIIMLPSLSLPHPEMHLRPEEVVPAVEIWPDFFHPVLKKTMVQLSQNFKNDKWGEFYAQGKPLLDF